MKLILAILVFLVLSGCSGELPSLDKARSDFVVFDMSDTKGVAVFSDRDSGEMYIYSEAEAFEERVQTSLLAAKLYQERADLDYVKVYHLPYGHPVLVGKGYYIAAAEYAPDGKGRGDTGLKHDVWQASGVEGEVDQISAMLAVMWFQMRPDHQLVDAMGQYTDEPALRRAILSMLKESGSKHSWDESMIKLPIYDLIDM